MEKYKNLTNLNGRDFIISTYKLVLDRHPDRDGLLYYETRLNNGHSKIEIINQIKSSSEASKLASNSTELDFAIKKYRITKIPILGWIYSILNIPSKEQRILRRSRAIERQISSVASDSKSSAEEIKSEISALSFLISNQKMQPGELNRYAFPNKIEQLNSNQNSSPRRLTELLKHQSIQSERNQIGIKNIVIDGHFSGAYSLASINRQLAQRLNSAFPNLKIRLSPREGNPTKEIWSIPGGESEQTELKSLVLGYDGESSEAIDSVRIYHHYPVVTDPNPLLGIPVILFFWEESIIPIETISIINSKYVGVIVATWYVKKALIDNGCTAPIQVVDLPMMGMFKINKRFDEKTASNQETNFLHISSAFPRKGVDVLLEAFSIVAADKSNVFLTIKTFHNPHNDIEKMISEIVPKNLQERIRIIISELSTDEMEDLYSHADALVLPTRGEGLNMPAIEAALREVKLIITGHGAHTDFIDENSAFFIDYSFEKAKTHLSKSGSVWANPKSESLVSCMRKICTIKEHTRNAKDHSLAQLSNQIEQRFLSPSSATGILAAVNNIYYNDRYSKLINHKSLTITMVTTWNEPCGIAEYSSYLTGCLSDIGIEVSVLSAISTQRRDQPQKNISLNADGWQKGRALELDPSNVKGQAVWIQHHFAWYELDDTLINTCKNLRKAGKLPFITLHTTRVISSFISDRKSKTAECLNYFERIFVHTIDDLNCLKDINIVDNVTLIPQGLPAPKFSDPTNSSAVKLIGGFGFLMQHKGIYELIAGFSKFIESDTSNKYKLRLVTSVKDESSFHHEYQRCIELISTLGTQENIEWFTDYLNADRSAELLSECNVILLPYLKTQESSSAAARFAISSCSHVAVSRESIFDEVRDLTYSLADTTPAAIADFLNKFYGNSNDINFDSIARNRLEWITSHGWPTVSHRYANVIKACMSDYRFMSYNQIN